MKRSLVLLLFLIFFLFFGTTKVLAQNKAGINIGDHWQDFDKAAAIVGPGGWVVVMACPGDGDKIAADIAKHPQVNLIIRGYYAGKTPNAALAKAWAATLGAIPTPNKIYFMPWNEPNQAGSADWADPSYLVDYIDKLIAAFAPIRGRVALLSPMLNHTWVGGQGDFDTYVNNVRRIKNNFFAQFDGIAMNLYDIADSCGRHPFCSTDPHHNPLLAPQLLDRMGVSGKPIFGVESGTAGNNFYFTQPPDSDSYLYRFVNNFLRNSPSQITMFAIPSYDLAGERGHTWSLYTPPDVTNLLASAPNGKTTPTSAGPVTSGLTKCPGKNYTFYEKNEAECQECGSIVEETIGEIFIPENSLFCTDFEIEQTMSFETPSGSSAPVLATRVDDVTGRIRLEEENVPDFSVTEKNLVSALPKLLPQNLKEMLSIDKTKLKTNAKHFVMGIQDGGLVPPEGSIPETEITHPEWWTALLGESKIVCGLFGTCQPPKSPIIKYQQPAKGNFSYASICPAGEPAKDSSLEKPLTLIEEFTTRSIWEITVSIVQRIINGVVQFFTRTEERVRLINRTRGDLAGGETFNQQITFADSFIPQDFKPEGKKGALLGDASYNLKPEEDLKFQKQALNRLRRCMQLCALYPTDFSIQAIDPLCPSCNTKDYPLTPSGMDDPYLDMSLCQKEAGACDYCLPLGQNGIGPSCTGDPICEGDKCCPMEFRQAKDYTSHGCPVPYGASDCNDPSVCRKMTFAENPDGGFGACQYQNQNVCVRTDREETGSCAAVCNWACCSY